MRARPPNASAAAADIAQHADSSLDGKQLGAPSDELAKFASTILGSTEDVWVPLLVLFAEAVESACGFNSAASGPFYCRLDSPVSINQFCNGAA